MSVRSSTSGRKPGPTPGILWKPGVSGSPLRVWVRTGHAAGSTATDRIVLPLDCLMCRDTPVIVPPVPTQETRMSMAPPVSFQISGPVVRSWIVDVAGLLNGSSST